MQHAQSYGLSHELESQPVLDSYPLTPQTKCNVKNCSCSTKYGVQKKSMGVGFRALSEPPIRSSCWVGCDVTVIDQLLKRSSICLETINRSRLPRRLEDASNLDTFFWQNILVFRLASSTSVEIESRRCWSTLSLTLVLSSKDADMSFIRHLKGSGQSKMWLMRSEIQRVYICLRHFLSNWR